MIFFQFLLFILHYQVYLQVDWGMIFKSHLCLANAIFHCIF